MKWLLLVGVASAANLKQLFKYRGGLCPDNCGSGFDSLNQGSKDYFNTISATLWTHPGNTDGFGVFQAELKCWFARMLTDKCGGLQPQPDRKKDLMDVCTKDHSFPGRNMFFKKMTPQEQDWWRSTFPADEDENKVAPFNQAMTTAKNLNLKEWMCTTLFVIDDGCVAHKYVKTD